MASEPRAEPFQPPPGFLLAVSVGAAMALALATLVAGAGVPLAVLAFVAVLTFGLTARKRTDMHSPHVEPVCGDPR